MIMRPRRSWKPSAGSPLSLISTIKSMTTAPGIDTRNLHFPLVHYISLGRNSPEFDELNEH